MRITGGIARGIPLSVPHGDAVRPATDGMRQAVFSSLAPRLQGVRFFDLFAGSGSYGLEALSRGAGSGVFVEKNPRALRCLKENLNAVCKSVGRNPLEAATVLPMDVLSAPLGAGAAPELVFMDPPWEMIEDFASSVFLKLDEVLKSVVDPIVIFEMPGQIELEPVGWTIVKRLGKGARQPSAVFYRRK